ncbi:hypothetical protein C8J57DRAFT_1258849 [Mycena rebaudengoi]|nr:hypothetical protein C8J57DRAFT_1258849 [Mycena rebaudengoi]
MSSNRAPPRHYHRPRECYLSGHPLSRSQRPTTRQQDMGFTSTDPTTAQLRTARAACEEAKINGDIITWSPVTNAEQPEIFERPAFRNKQGILTQLPASAFNNIPKFIGPHCPHAMNGFRLANDTAMKVRNTKKNGWFFQAPGHNCEFTISIPRLTSSKIKLNGDPDSEEDGEWGDEHQADDDNYEMGRLSPEAQAQVQMINEATSEKMAVYSLSWPQVPPPIYSSPVKTISSPFYPSSDPPPYPSSPYPSSPIASSSSSPTRPQPKPTTNLGSQKSFFTEREAALSRISGYPEQHPAWRVPPPAVIREFVPQNAREPLMQFMTTLCGQMICQLNSAMGLPKITFIRLLVQNLRCSSCMRNFSVEAYHDHRRQGVCTNTPYLDEIPELHPDIEGLYDMAFRSYPKGITLPTHTDDINTTLGRAWIAWNCRTGVTKDVWAVLSTAYTHCRHCDLVRTFDGDKSHRDENHICLDVGQGSVGTMFRGTGKPGAPDGTMVVWRM